MELFSHLDKKSPWHALSNILASVAALRSARKFPWHWVRASPRAPISLTFGPLVLFFWQPCAVSRISLRRGGYTRDYAEFRAASRLLPTPLNFGKHAPPEQYIHTCSCSFVVLFASSPPLDFRTPPAQIMEEQRKDTKRLQNRRRAAKRRRDAATGLSAWTLQAAMLISLALQYDFAAGAEWLRL